MDDAYWLPVVTLILGAVGGFLADYLREGQAAKRERQAVSTAFQRETLIALQDWMTKLLRAAALMHDEMLADYRHSGDWAEANASASLQADRAEAAREVHRQRVRVLDDEIRNGAERLVGLAADVISGSRSGEDPRRARRRSIVALGEIYNGWGELNDRIGERLRESL